MKWFFKMMLPALVLVSCSEEGGSPVEIDPVSTKEKSEIVSHEKIELGRKLENPYSVANVRKAMTALFPTRALVDVPVSDLYVRFLPEDADDLAMLSDLGLDLFDYPLDREILKTGDYYHDPSVPQGEITWQYAVVPSDFVFPSGIAYEIMDECFIPDENVVTKGFEDVDWDSVERKAFEITGNSDMLEPQTRGRVKPSGRITIVDDKLRKTVGVSCVKVLANVFVRISSTYTDKDGKYQFSMKFSARPHYKIRFKNKIGFTIGLNKILVQASTSSIGKGSNDGVNVKIDSKSDATLFRRCVVNNAAYDYYMKCEKTGVTKPANNIRFWILDILKPSSTLMIHHGAFLDNKLVSKYLGVYASIVRIFSPDITIGSKGKNGNYAELYMSTIHEMAHATHFAKAGTGYWKYYATYILTSFIGTGECYGTGSGNYAGYCEVGEMWAYYIENAIYKERYGGNSSDGHNYWFKPQILKELEAGGVRRSDICAALSPYTIDTKTFRDALITTTSGKSALINKVFDKYKK